MEPRSKTATKIRRPRTNYEWDAYPISLQADSNHRSLSVPGCRLQISRSGVNEEEEPLNSIEDSGLYFGCVGYFAI